MRHGLVSLARGRSAGSGGRRGRRVPAGFEAVGEALEAGRSPEAACAVVGRALAWDGVSLGEALAGLRATTAAIGVSAPGADAVEALAVAWSEATLEFIHAVSCEDPLTGLASLPHLRTRLAEVYREAERSARCVKDSHALFVVEVGGDTGGDVPTDSFARAFRFSAVAEALQTVFSGEETIARVGAHRVVALVRRTADLGETVAIARERLVDVGVRGARSWIEGLPPGPDLGVRVLSELAR